MADLGKWVRRLATIAIASGVTAFCFDRCTNDPESFGAKAENSALQAIQAQYRLRPANGFEILSDDKYRFACFPANGERICIMLNPRHNPFYKQSPWGKDFELSADDFHQIEQTPQTTLTVLQSVASHVKPPSPQQDK